MNRITTGVALTALLASACTLGPNYQKPDTWQPQSWQSLPHGGGVQTSEHVPELAGANGQVLQAPMSSTTVDAGWWKCFNDPVLEDLESRAAQQNLDVRQALATIMESRAQRRIAGAGLFPSANANASGEREKPSQKGLLGLFGGSANGGAAQSPGAAANGSLGSGSGGVGGSLFNPVNLFQDGFEVSWQLDLFGQVRRSLESADATVAASEAAVRGMRLSIAAEVATNYVNFRTAQANLALAHELISTAEETQRLTEDRAQRGMGSQGDVENAIAQTEGLRAQVPQYETAQASAENALTLLLGLPPGALARDLSAGRGIPVVVGSIPVGLPSDLVRYRPDILQADANLHAAVANIGVAKANFYPSVSLSASGGFQAIKLSNLGSWSARQFAIGPTLSLPIFDGGQLSGNLQLREAQAQGAALAYQKTVLSAWQEVDTGLATVQDEARRTASLDRQSLSAQRAFVIARDRYRHGLEPFLSVLDAERTVLNARLQSTESVALMANDVVQLYRAVGGGWPTVEPTSGREPFEPKS